MYKFLIKKAEEIIEALPYLQKFHGKTFVVKYGGAAMTDPELKDKVLQDIVLLNLVGIKTVLVHGGGKEINKLLEKKKIKVEFVMGFRKTGVETVQIVEKALGKVNSELAKIIKKHGGFPVRYTGRLGRLIKAKKMLVNGKVDIGYVGEVDKIKKSTLLKTLKKGKVPVISSVGIGADNKVYNINADTAASAIAKMIKADKLILMTDVTGVLDKDGKLISEINTSNAQHLIDKGIISGGMIPKVSYGLDAISNGVGKVHIIDGKLPHALLLEIFTNRGIGTMLVK
jgi:acetylglutamate kinase